MSPRRRHVLRGRRPPGGTRASRSLTPTRHVSRSPRGRTIPRSRRSSVSPRRRHVLRGRHSPGGTRASRSLTPTRHVSRSPSGRTVPRSPRTGRRLIGRPSTRRSLSTSPSRSRSRYRDRYGRESRSTRTPTTRYERSRSVTPTGRRSASLTPPGTRRRSRSPRGTRRGAGRRSRSYTLTPSRSITPSSTRSLRRPPPTQPTTTVLIGPAPSGVAPTFVGYDPDVRRSGVAVPRSAGEEEHGGPAPQMRTGAHIRQ